MAGPGQIPSPMFLVILAIGLALAPGATHAVVSGETLGAGTRGGQYSFDVVGSDCNLLVNHGVWHSSTAGRGGGCRLTFEGDGRLVVRAQDGATIWASPAEPKPEGEYAAVITATGSLTVYGPVVWSEEGNGDGRLLRRTLRCLMGGTRDNCILRLPRRGGRRPGARKLNCLHLGKWDNCIIDAAAPTANHIVFSGERRHLPLPGGGCGGGVRCSLFLRHNDDERGEPALVDDRDARELPGATIEVQNKEIASPCPGRMGRRSPCTAPPSPRPPTELRRSTA